MAKFRELLHGGVMFWCTACQQAHGSDLWKETGNQTLNSSVMLRGHIGHGKIGVCHVSVTNGMLIYHHDCTHEFKGKTVPLEDFPE